LQAGVRPLTNHQSLLTNHPLQQEGKKRMLYKKLFSKKSVPLAALAVMILLPAVDRYRTGSL
jgi:hypothetical protein